MFIFNFDDLDKEAADAIHFEEALKIIAKSNNRSIKEVATLLNRAMDSFRHDYPYSGLEFRLYNYELNTGFQTSSRITMLSKGFLAEISKGSDFFEDKEYEISGTYRFMSDIVGEVRYYSFYFKISELLRFFIENKLSIPDEFSDSLAVAEKSHTFYKALIKKDIDKFFEDTFGDDDKDERNSSVEATDAEWTEFAGKDTALMMIAGLSVALQKSGGKYLRGEKLNKSALARSAIHAINEYGEGTEISTKALTDLLNEALSSKLNKLQA